MKIDTNKIIYIFAILFILTSTSSCSWFTKKNQNTHLRSGQIIRTYDSPSAYYQKPITRIYTNPYNPGGGDIYFDNDNYYVPPKNYGINTDNYNPRYRNYAPKPRVVKRYRYIKRY